MRPDPSTEGVVHRMCERGHLTHGEEGESGQRQLETEPESEESREKADGHEPG